jgi:hypothetical protein
MIKEKRGREEERKRGYFRWEKVKKSRENTKMDGCYELQWRRNVKKKKTRR